MRSHCAVYSLTLTYVQYFIDWRFNKIKVRIEHPVIEIWCSINLSVFWPQMATNAISNWSARIKLYRTWYVAIVRWSSLVPLTHLYLRYLYLRSFYLWCLIHLLIIPCRSLSLWSPSHNIFLWSLSLRSFCFVHFPLAPSPLIQFLSSSNPSLATKIKFHVLAFLIVLFLHEREQKNEPDSIVS